MNKQHAPRGLGTSALWHALTAAAAFAAGVLVGPRFTHEPPPMTSVSLASTGIIPQATALRDALEQLPGGVEREIDPGVIVKPLLSYSAASGIWCRRFELRAASGRTDAIACRGTDEWRIAALATGPNNEGDAGDDRSKDGSVIDAVIAATIDGDPLDYQDELEVLVDGWYPTRD
jgi:hypothetical protein